MKLKFVKDFVKKTVMRISYCESKAMRADILTKTLRAPRLDELRELVMLVDKHAQPGKEC